MQQGRFVPAENLRSIHKTLTTQYLLHFVFEIVPPKSSKQSISRYAMVPEQRFFRICLFSSWLDMVRGVRGLEGLEWLDNKGSSILQTLFEYFGILCVGYGVIEGLLKRILEDMHSRLSQEGKCLLSQNQPNNIWSDSLELILKIWIKNKYMNSFIVSLEAIALSRTIENIFCRFV